MPPSVSAARRRALAMLFLTLALPAAVAADGLTISDVLRLRSVEEVAIAPAGGEIAYVLEVPRQPFEEDDGKAHLELHLIAPGGGASRPYVTGARVKKISWTADGREIAFLAQRGDDEHPTLYAIARGGGEARRLLELESEVTSYALGPGGRLAALAVEPEDEAREKLREQGFDRVVFEEEERPVRVWLGEHAAGSGKPAVARPLELDGHARGVAWSPGGERLAVEVSPRGGPDQGMVATRVWIVDPASGEVAARLANPGKLGDVAWSPDGRHLAMISAADPADPREGRLMVARAPAWELRDLLPELAERGHVAAFAWASDDSLVFLAQEGVETRLGTVTLDGRAATLHPAGGLVIEKLSRAESGELALVGSTPEHPDEVFHLAPGGEPRRLSDSNPWLAERRLATQEVVSYRARDGLEIEGLLLRPLDPGAPGTRHPLIVVVHGGPEAHFRNGWLTTYSRPGQAAAARGFAVLYPNYRASTGRGVEFSKLDHGDPAGKEFDDLVDGVDHLIASGLVDGERVGITGGSYGGYATAWAATRFSERFAAAVMIVGISNKTSLLGTSDIPVELYQVHERRWPWDDWAFALERSPIAHVERARTPILILHGDSDTRVHPAQSLQLYRYLKLLDRTPVRLVLYPGEKHGNERAASRLDLALRLMRWMEHYLSGPGGEPPPSEIDYVQAMPD